MPTPNSKNKAKSDPKTKKATKPVDETPDMDERDEAEQTDEQPADDRLDMDDQDDGQANDPAPPKQPPANSKSRPAVARVIRTVPHAHSAANRTVPCCARRTAQKRSSRGTSAKSAAGEQRLPGRRSASEFGEAAAGKTFR